MMNDCCWGIEQPLSTLNSRDSRPHPIIIFHDIVIAMAMMVPLLPKPMRRRRLHQIGLILTVAASGWMLLEFDSINDDISSSVSVPVPLYIDDEGGPRPQVVVGGNNRQLMLPFDGYAIHKLLRSWRRTSSNNNALQEQRNEEPTDKATVTLPQNKRGTARGGLTIAARGAGPELAALDGTIHKFEEPRHPGVNWYELLSSRKLQWNMSPHRWNNCPDGANVFLGDTGFSFHEILEDPDASPDDAEIVRSKQLRFSVGRKDHRECLWNYSKSCLAGGSFVMNLGAMSRDLLYPGDFSLKTLRNEDNGPIRIVAYNTNTACMLRTHDESHNIQMKGRLIDQENTREAHLDKPPIDYLRRSISSTMDPEGCERWIEERTSNNDLFTFNSDMSTVHVDTPWLQIIVQVRQNKVATKTSCSYAAMNVWITDISPELLEEDIAGLLGDATLAARGRRKQRGRRLNQQMVKGNGNRVRSDHDVHLVDGPFDSPMTSSHF
mmetsp:Transcript_1712/g.3414  ORF Transcript_1712/g.3414 Transcript_1712/m.3414 type:complete len:493 (+) Transcript_1712:32-1510(+)